MTKIDFKTRGQELINQHPEILEALGMLAVGIADTRANDPERRVEAQELAIKAFGAICEVSGLARLLRGRWVASANNLATGELGTDADYFALLSADVEKGGNHELRAMFARSAYDLRSILGPQLAAILAAHFLATSEGREGLLTSPAAVNGVSPDSGRANELKQLIISQAGYAAGYEGKAQNTPAAFWERAAARHNLLAKEYRKKGALVPDVTPITIKAWCKRDGTKILFSQSAAEGASDKTNSVLKMSSFL